MLSFLKSDVIRLPITKGKGEWGKGKGMEKEGEQEKIQQKDHVQLYLEAIEKFIPKYCRLGYKLLYKFWHYASEYDYASKAIFLHLKYPYIWYGLFVKLKLVIFLNLELFSIFLRHLVDQHFRIPLKKFNTRKKKNPEYLVFTINRGFKN